MKLRNFYKIDHKKNPIPASNIRRKSKPQGHQWIEMPNFCCEPLNIPCTCDFRYFVQVDLNGNPIDYTLVKRKSKPRSIGNIRWQEVVPNQCCMSSLFNLEYLLTTDGDIESGSFIISVNGDPVIDINAAENQIIYVNVGDSVEVDFQVPGNCSNINITKDAILLDGATDTGSYTYNFTIEAGSMYKIVANFIAGTCGE